jgi:glycerol-3-phosphate acyltransferase PlsY
MPDLLGGFAYTWPFYAAIPICYLIGSIPFGFLIARAAGLGDIRRTGSGNIGATNVLRTGHKGLAALTFALDVGKGVAAVAVAGIYGPDFEYIAGLSVVIGHMFPVWLRFRGGKGVATSFGVLLTVSWPVALAAAALWALAAAVVRIVSVASMVGAVAAPAMLWGMLALQRDQTLPYWLPGLPQHVDMLVVLAALVVLRHHANIRRLLKGEEPRIGQSAP